MQRESRPVRLCKRHAACAPRPVFSARQERDVKEGNWKDEKSKEERIPLSCGVAMSVNFWRHLPRCIIYWWMVSSQVTTTSMLVAVVRRRLFVSPPVIIIFRSRSRLSPRQRREWWLCWLQAYSVKVETSCSTLPFCSMLRVHTFIGKDDFSGEGTTR